MYELYYTREAKKDYKKISEPKLKHKVLYLLEILKLDPFQNTPAFKKLRGDYTGLYSRRINLQHRLFYEVDTQAKRVKVIRMWTHYGDN